jgi:hypothetical protein
MNPILVIAVVFLVLIAGGVVFDVRRRRLTAPSHDIGLTTRNSRRAADSHGEVGGNTGP